jgi:hypothetical protein
MPTFSSRLMIIPEENFAVFLSVAAGRAPTRDSLARDMAKKFFPPRVAPAFESSADIDDAWMGVSFMSTRVNYMGCTKLLFVLQQFFSPPLCKFAPCFSPPISHVLT